MGGDGWLEVQLDDVLLFQWWITPYGTMKSCDHVKKSMIEANG